VSGVRLPLAAIAAGLVATFCGYSSGPLFMASEAMLTGDFSRALGGLELALSLGALGIFSNSAAAVLVSIIFGIPFYLILRKYRWNSILVFSIYGFALAMIFNWPVKIDSYVVWIEAHPHESIWRWLVIVISWSFWTGVPASVVFKLISK
jgi:hypothetical protein